MYAVPTWGSPVGDGAMRTRTGSAMGAFVYHEPAGAQGLKPVGSGASPVTKSPGLPSAGLDASTPASGAGLAVTMKKLRWVTSPRAAVAVAVAPATAVHEPPGCAVQSVTLALPAV